MTENFTRRACLAGAVFRLEDARLRPGWLLGMKLTTVILRVDAQRFQSVASASFALLIPRIPASGVNPNVSYIHRAEWEDYVAALFDTATPCAPPCGRRQRLAVEPLDYTAPKGPSFRQCSWQTAVELSRPRALIEERSPVLSGPFLGSRFAGWLIEICPFLPAKVAKVAKVGSRRRWISRFSNFSSLAATNICCLRRSKGTRVERAIKGHFKAPARRQASLRRSPLMTAPPGIRMSHP